MWKAIPSNLLEDGPLYEIADEHGSYVATAYGNNAHLIVRAVNSHRELLEAAQAALETLDFYGMPEAKPETAKRLLRAAIERART
jgi:hypothetical protein